MRMQFAGLDKNWFLHQLRANSDIFVQFRTCEDESGSRWIIDFSEDGEEQ